MIEKYKIKEFKITAGKAFLIFIKHLPPIKQIPSSPYLQLMHLLSSSGPGHLHVNSKSLKSQGLFQTSKIPGPGACRGSLFDFNNNDRHR